MAKQIYIDENGNEVLVSGTITNAGNLPLGSDFSDPTSTAGAIKALQDKIDFSSVTGTKFEIVGNRLLITLYSNAEKTNGLRIDFNGTSNVIQLATLVNGTFTVVNSIVFTHV